MDKAPDAFRTISEVAQELDLPQHVLRFWETRFAQIKPMKRGGGRRYYRPDDVDLLRGIRYLLYGEGYTIRGVQRLLKENGGRFVQSVWQSGAPQPEPRGADESGEDEASDEDFRALPPARGLALSPVEDGEDEPMSPRRRANPSRANPVLTGVGSTTERANGEAIRPEIESSVEADGAPAPEDRSDGSSEVAEPSANPRLSRDDVRKLQATLFELGECRRLLEAALKDEL